MLNSGTEKKKVAVKFLRERKRGRVTSGSTEHIVYIRGRTCSRPLLNARAATALRVGVRAAGKASRGSLNDGPHRPVQVAEPISRKTAKRFFNLTTYDVSVQHFRNKRNSSVITVTRLRSGPVNRRSNPAKGKRFFSSPEGPDYVLESLGVNSIGGWVGPRGCRTV